MRREDAVPPGQAARTSHLVDGEIVAHGPGAKTGLPAVAGLPGAGLILWPRPGGGGNIERRRDEAHGPVTLYELATVVSAEGPVVGDAPGKNRLDLVGGSVGRSTPWRRRRTRITQGTRESLKVIVPSSTWGRYSDLN